MVVQPYAREAEFDRFLSLVCLDFRGYHGTTFRGTTLPVSFGCCCASFHPLRVGLGLFGFSEKAPSRCYEKKCVETVAGMQAGRQVHFQYASAVVPCFELRIAKNHNHF